MSYQSLTRQRILSAAVQSMEEHLARTNYGSGNIILPIREVRREVAYDISGQHGGELSRLRPSDTLPSKYLNGIVEDAAIQIRYERKIVNGRECWVKRKISK